MIHLIFPGSMPANGETAFIIGVGGTVLVILLMIVIAGVFFLIGKCMNKKKCAPEKACNSSPSQEGLSPETIAAISAAVHQYLHEKGTSGAVLTIERKISPWSSKIYGTNRFVFNSRRR